MTMMIWTYTIYVAVSLAITIWVGRSLNRNGRTFLVANFEGQEALADSVNHLLLVGFYLVNIGFVSLALRYGDKPTNTVAAVEFLSTKIGLVIVVLGIMHFFNMRGLLAFRRSALFRAIGGEPAQPQPATIPAATTAPAPVLPGAAVAPVS